MKDEAIEKELENRAENIEVRDFSLVWDDIKESVTPAKKTKKRRIYHWVTAAVSAVCLICCVVFLPMLLTKPAENPEKIYLLNQLGAVEVGEEKFYRELNKTDINYIDFSEYIESYHFLFQTEDKLTKGASLRLSDDSDNPTFILDIDFFDNDVEGKDIISPELDKRFEKNGATIYYRVKEASEEESFYVYEIRTQYNSVKYYMEYTSMEPNVETFLDALFK